MSRILILLLAALLGLPAWSTPIADLAPAQKLCQRILLRPKNGAIPLANYTNWTFSGSIRAHRDYYRLKHHLTDQIESGVLWAVPNERDYFPRGEKYVVMFRITNGHTVKDYMHTMYFTTEGTSIHFTRHETPSLSAQGWFFNSLSERLGLSRKEIIPTSGPFQRAIISVPPNIYAKIVFKHGLNRSIVEEILNSTHLDENPHGDRIELLGQIKESGMNKRIKLVLEYNSTNHWTLISAFLVK